MYFTIYTNVSTSLINRLVAIRLLLRTPYSVSDGGGRISIVVASKIFRSGFYSFEFWVVSVTALYMYDKDVGIGAST